jgi:DnaJ-class molecular chaperone
LTAVGWVWLIGLGMLGLAWHAALCWISPFTYCRRCGGTGQRKPLLFKGSKNYGRCRKCKGSGTRLRTGRKITNFLTGQRGAAR